jgi:2-methylcitrate dehydratase
VLDREARAHLRITEEIARRVSATSIADLPTEVVDYSATLAMSALGAMIAGHRCSGGPAMVAYVGRHGGAADASVLGAGIKSSVELAAMANGTFAHATEYEDDSFPEAVSSYTLFPAIFALGEYLGSSGARAIEAFAAGYEAQARIGLACREARRLGYMVLSLAGSIGCAVSASKLLGFDAKKTTMAISIAASQGSGIGCQTGSMAHIVEMGFAARNGITAAMLAAAGFTGQPDVLEAQRGLFNIITAGKVENSDKIITDWGRPYRVLEVGIKHYPCCYHLQRIIESTLDLKQQRGLGPDEIAEVEVEVNAFFPTVVQHPEPHDEIEAQFSLPHAVAIAILEPRVLPDGFSKEKINAEAFRRFRSKVKTVVREDWGWNPTGWTPRITYRLQSGEVIVREPKTARGQPPELLSFDACVPKYRGCVEGLLPEERIARSIEMLCDLRHSSNVGDIVRTVAG